MVSVSFVLNEFWKEKKTENGFKFVLGEKKVSMFSELLLW